MTEDDERKCFALWTAIKEMDTIPVESENTKRTIDTALGFIAKDANIIFRSLGYYH
jgi:hypothetical protein